MEMIPLNWSVLQKTSCSSDMKAREMCTVPQYSIVIQISIFLFRNVDNKYNSFLLNKTNAFT